MSDDELFFKIVASWIIFALIIGFAVRLIFKKWGEYKEHNPEEDEE
jgi:hypothetical protein